MDFLRILHFRLILLLSIVFLWSCFKPAPEPLEEEPSSLAYIGSVSCRDCHYTIFSSFIESGHAYALNKVISRTHPVLPFLPNGTQLVTPNGYDWNSISYVIGGYANKSLFLDSKGYVITQVEYSQYHIKDGTSRIYDETHMPGTQTFTCGKCHTTGWVGSSDPRQVKDGLQGMGGNFFATGIQCESCHGMGNIHAFTSEKEDIVVDKSALQCATCHSLYAPTYEIRCNDGLIESGQEYNSLLSGAHKSMYCTDCHDPHASTAYDQQASGTGISSSCISCHTHAILRTYQTSGSHQNLTCSDCHMPGIVLSAVKSTTYSGDQKAHIYTIRIDTVSQFIQDSLVNVDKLGMSLEFVCYQCHKDASGTGGVAGTLTLSQLYSLANNFHGTH